MNTTIHLQNEPRDLFGIDLRHSPNKDWKYEGCENDDFATYYKFTRTYKYNNFEVSASAEVEDNKGGSIQIKIPYYEKSVIYEMIQELEQKLLINHCSIEEIESKYSYIVDNASIANPYEWQVESNNLSHNIFIISLSKSIIGDFYFTIHLLDCNENMILEEENVSFTEDEAICDDIDSYEDEEVDSYSIEDVWVTGYVHLSDYEKQYIAENVNTGDRVYFRNEFDNPVDKNALLVLHEGVKIGYVQAHKAEILLGLLRASKIGFIKISSIESLSNNNVGINLDVYYQDKSGLESLPYYPLAGRPISVVQTDLWTNQEDYLEDWHLCFNTDQLCYKFKDLFDKNEYSKNETIIGIYFDMIISHYLDGRWITKRSVEDCISHLDDCAKQAIRTQVESYMEYLDYKFIE